VVRAGLWMLASFREAVAASTVLLC